MKKNHFFIFLIFSISISMAQNPATDFAGGEGSEAMPYLITNAQQLSNIRFYLGVNNANLHFRITQDIDLSVLNWEPIGPSLDNAFHGKLHGGGHHLQGLNIGQNGNPNYRYAGLFGVIRTGAVIDSVYLVGGKIRTFESNSSCSGAIAGFANANTPLAGVPVNEIIISNCFSSVDFESFSQLTTEIGGMVGRAQAIATTGIFIRLIFENCRNEGQIISHYSTSMLGGILGNNSSFDDADIWLQFLNCSNSGEIKSPGALSYVGGILGNTFAENNAKLLFKGCYNTGNISGGTSESYTGGIIGYSRIFCESFEIEDCYSVAHIHTLDNYVGGIVGDILTGDTSRIRVRNCYVAGSISGQAMYAGGIVGRSVQSDADYVIENCVSLLSSIEYSPVGFAAGRILSESFGAELLNNYALSNMIINGQLVASSSSTSINGLDQSLRNLQSIATYHEQLFWDISMGENTTWAINNEKSYPYFPKQSAPPFINSLFRDSVALELMNNVELLTVSRTDTAEPLFLIENIPAGSSTVAVELADYQAQTILSFSTKENSKEPSYPVWTSIQRRMITITADEQKKCYGDPDPELTYTIMPPLIEGDQLEGSLTRQQGEEAGIYYIQQGTLSNSDYTIIYVRSNFTITKVNTTIHEEHGVLTAAAPNATYQWLNCEADFAPIVGATQRSFIPQDNGIFAVQVTVNSCVDTSICHTFTVSIDDWIIDNNIEIYPNPMQDILYIDFGKEYRNIKVSIYNTLGQNVLTQSYRSMQKIEIPMSVTQGVYFVRFILDGNSVSGGKVIKH